MTELRKCTHENETFYIEKPNLEVEETKCSCGCGKTVGYIGKKNPHLINSKENEMSKIRDIVSKHVNEYNIKKTGKWNNPEPPPENIFTKRELYQVCFSIAQEIEGLLADSIINKFKGEK